jgi:hypothetical protein
MYCKMVEKPGQFLKIVLVEKARQDLRRPGAAGTQWEPANCRFSNGSERRKVLPWQAGLFVASNAEALAWPAWWVIPGVGWRMVHRVVCCWFMQVGETPCFDSSLPWPLQSPEFWRLRRRARFIITPAGVAADMAAADMVDMAAVDTVAADMAGMDTVDMVTAAIVVTVTVGTVMAWHRTAMVVIRWLDIEFMDRLFRRCFISPRLRPLRLLAMP